MTIAVMKTKAEQALTEQFEAVADRLPGAAWVPGARRAALGEFAALGLPHRRIEEWKYTDLRAALKEALQPALPAKSRLDRAAVARALGSGLGHLDALRIVFVNGTFLRSETRPDMPAGVEWHFDPLSRTLGQPGSDWMKAHFEAGGEPGRDAILALNAAFVTDGAVIRVEEGAKLPVPIHIVFVAGGKEPASVTTRNLIEVGEDAECTILESHVSLGDAPRQSNTATEMHIGDHARVAHIKVVGEGVRASHIGNWITRIGAEATYRGFQFTSGAGLARNQIHVTFAGEGANLDLSGAFLARGNEHIDTTLVVDHAVPGCTSRELFKGVLDGRARGIFQGKIIVRADAQKTDGKQMAQALMLSPDAEFDSKPELEIYADDVICGHGSTAAELDEDLLFYCRARGIPLAEARALLTQSFVGEAIEKVEHEGIREALMQAARDWLAWREEPEA